MGKEWLRSEWLKQIAVAVAYALVYIAIRPFSDAHWALTSGLRVACLLLMPYRYWPALVVGEVFPLTYNSWLCLDQFGIGWVILRSIPPVATAMPIVWYCRRHAGLFPAPNTIDVKTLLLCVLTSSLMWTVISYAAMLVAASHVDPSLRPIPIDFVALLVGNYVAILTIVTWPLLLKIANDGRTYKELVNAALVAPLTRDAVTIVLPSLIVLSIISLHVNTEWKQTSQMLLFAPVLWLTIKYGWRGTAVSGPLAVACICAMTKSLDIPDPAVIQVQAGIAFAVTCLFFMGASVAAQLYMIERETQSVRNALRVAQQCIQQGELRLRRTSSALEAINGAASITQRRIIQRIHPLLAVDERESLSRQANATSTQLYRLAEALHPVAWRDRGLGGALKETIGRELDEAGIAYSCTLEGRDLSQLSAVVHQTIYRIACEAVSMVTVPQTCHDVRVVLRGGKQSNGRRWVVIRVIGKQNGLDLRQLAFHHSGRISIGAKLGVQGMDAAALHDQAALFNGSAHVKRGDNSIIVSALLHDAEHLSPGHAINRPAAKMWVR